MHTLRLKSDVKTHEVEPSDRPLSVGRTDGCDIPVEGRSVSRQHAELAYREGDGWYLRDLGSRFGTQLNGSPISGPVRLNAGDRITLGKVTLTVGLEASPDDVGHDTTNVAAAVSAPPPPAPAPPPPSLPPASEHGTSPAGRIEAPSRHMRKRSVRIPIHADSTVKTAAVLGFIVILLVLGAAMMPGNRDRRPINRGTPVTHKTPVDLDDPEPPVASVAPAVPATPGAATGIMPPDSQASGILPPAASAAPEPVKGIRPAMPDGDREAEKTREAAVATGDLAGTPAAAPAPAEGGTPVSVKAPGTPVTPPTAPTPPKPVTPPAPRPSPQKLLSDFATASDPAVRKSAFDLLTELDPAAVKILKGIVDKKLADDEKTYTARLIPRIRAAYLERLAGLTDEQIRHVQKTRRLWTCYFQGSANTKDFQRKFIQPVHEMAGFLLFDVRELKDPGIQAQRDRLEECAAYQARCSAILKIDPDPTAGKTSPTGIAYAPLTQPPTVLDTLRHLERTLVLAHTVAPPGARPALLMCDRAAREIDVQEAEFTMFCNEIRMLTGTVAWRVDPLGSAVTRDHSNDRKEGRASGHMSDVPGKRGFTDRNQRMGAPFHNSEGAGGGRSGRDYAMGLSYGGGHTGPLYSLQRNCVGVGRRDGVYTSQYRYDPAIVHPCPLTEDELWMPPGIEAKDLRDPGLLSLYQTVKAGAFGVTIRLADRMQPKNDLDRALAAFFRAAAAIEADWFAEGVLQVERTGDVFLAKVRLQDGLNRFKGIEGFEEKVAPAAERLAAQDLIPLLRAGEVFYRVVSTPQDEAQSVQAMGPYRQAFKDTIYAEAFKAVMEDASKQKKWYDFFLERNPDAADHQYPPPLHDRGKK